jgi:outer membrane protein
VRAQELVLASIRGAYGPSLFVSTDLSDNGPSLNRLVWNWSAQLSLRWNIFQGWVTTAQEREARASLVGLGAQRDLLRQQVRLELEQARLALSGAKAALLATDEAVESARERLRLAEGRYQQGVGNIIEMGDAQLAMTQAAAQQVRARFDVSTARARLLLALGGG